MLSIYKLCNVIAPSPGTGTPYKLDLTLLPRETLLLYLDGKLFPALVHVLLC